MTRKIQSRRAVPKPARPLGNPDGPVPTASTVPATAATTTTTPPKPGVLARWLTRAILSRWVISRVGNPDILALLLTVARGSGHQRAIATLSQRLEGALASAVVAPVPDAVSPPALSPRQLSALRDQAGALCARDDRTGTAAAIGALLAQSPDDPILLRCFGVALAADGAHEAAIAAFRRGLSARPDDAETLHNLGKALRALGSLDEAGASHRRALELRPKYAEAHNSLGIVCQAQGQLEEAEACYRRAVACHPGFAAAHNNLGLIREQQQQLHDAIDHFRRAVAIQPDFAEAHYNLGCVLRNLAQFEPAQAAFEQACLVKPDYAKAHFNEGLLRLRRGDYALGWQKHEWRLKYLYCIIEQYHKPMWDGSDLARKTILLHAEAGLGDTIQFVRYARLVKQKGARVVVSCQPELVRLFKRMPEIDRVVAKGRRLPGYDCHAPMMSLPWLCRTTLDTVPAGTPYLSADPAPAAAWAERLRPFSGTRVGLVWAGNALLGQAELIEMDRRRSMTLSQFLPVLQVPGVHFFSLQKGEPAGQARLPLPGAALIDFMESVTDFADTAALVANLDLVIGVDTSCIHLAGALGKPAWLLSRFNGCWRWLEDREDSPWYPSVRLFRQPRPGDWETPMAAVAARLAGFAAARPGALPLDPTKGLRPLETGIK
jgi:tetratricopeptide (TPR) repeat protein